MFTKYALLHESPGSVPRSFIRPSLHGTASWPWGAGPREASFTHNLTAISNPVIGSVIAAERPELFEMPPLPKEWVARRISGESPKSQ